MKYICTQDLYLDKYDENGFLIENKYVRIPKGSIWEEDNESYKLVGSQDCIHLDRVWKSKKAKTHQWIEITKEHFDTYFCRLYEQGDHVSINGVNYVISKVSKDKTLDNPYLVSTWVNPKYFDQTN